MSQKKNFWIIISAAVACGLAAGVLGGIIAQSYAGMSLADFYSSSEVNLSNLSASSGLVIRDPKNVVVSQDIKAGETLASVRPALVGVFKTLAGSTAAEAAGQAVAYYDLDQPLFTGLIITADGWVVASVPSDIKNDFKIKNYTVLTSERKSYTIDRLADTEDMPGGLLVFHLASAGNLPVKKNAARADLSLGQSLLVVSGLDAVWPASLAGWEKSSTLMNSDSVASRLRLSGTSGGAVKNSFIFNFAGDLVAIANNSGETIPAFSYNAFWRAFLKGQPVQPSLGVNYLDLSAIKAEGINYDKGAYLYAPAGTLAVLENSPAAAAGLAAGDIITAIDNQELNAANGLADVLSAYNAGDKITVSYRRAGRDMEAEITLGLFGAPKK